MEGEERRRGGEQRAGKGREVNLFIHAPTSRSPAPAASTGNNSDNSNYYCYYLLPVFAAGAGDREVGNV